MVDDIKAASVALNRLLDDIQERLNPKMVAAERHLREMAELLEQEEAIVTTLDALGRGANQASARRAGAAVRDRHYKRLRERVADLSNEIHHARGRRRVLQQRMEAFDEPRLAVQRTSEVPGSTGGIGGEVERLAEPDGIVRVMELAERLMETGGYSSPSSAYNSAHAFLERSDRFKRVSPGTYGRVDDREENSRKNER